MYTNLGDVQVNGTGLLGDGTPGTLAKSPILFDRLFPRASDSQAGGECAAALTGYSPVTDLYGNTIMGKGPWGKFSMTCQLCLGTLSHELFPWQASR